MSWAGQQDKVPSPHPEEQSGTVCSQPQTAGVCDGVTEHPSFKTPVTSKIRKLSLNHTSPLPSPGGHNLSLGHSHIEVPSWCDPCASQEVAWQPPRGIAAMASQLRLLAPPSFDLLSPHPGTPPPPGAPHPPTGVTAPALPPCTHSPSILHLTHHPCLAPPRATHSL